MANLTSSLAILMFLWTYAKAYTVTADQLSNNHSISNNNTEDTINGEIFLFDKDPSLLECYFTKLDQDEFEILPNGSAYVPTYGRAYNESFYILFNNSLSVCIPSDPEGYPDDVNTSKVIKPAIEYISKIGIIISMICLLLHLIAFSFVPDLQNLPGYNLASLCLSLLLSYVFLIIGENQQDASQPLLCTMAGVLAQFFFLAAFLWMFVMAFDIFRSILLATGSLRISNKEFKVKKFVWYSMFSWLLALVFTVAAVIADNVEVVPESYRPMFHKSCWFENKSALLVFFAIPMSILMFLNFLMFAASAYSIFKNRMKSGQENQNSSLKKNHLLYFRLTVIMGITWITGIVAPIAHVVWLWYVFSALNAFQGLFIFLAFTCTQKVKNHFKNKLFDERRSSEQITSPTFQSYCFYANSIEKDLDKVVENKEKSEKIDTIMIHL